MTEKRITEAELVLPTLYLMEQNGGSITTSELIPKLTELMKPQGTDAELLPNRGDTYFSQKVRNLKSHDTLEKRLYATYGANGYTITDEGRSFIRQNEKNMEYLFTQVFDYNDVRTSLGKLCTSNETEVLPYQEIVSEGATSSRMSKTTQRSQKLRAAAIEHFSHNGVIQCDCCGFEFKSFYGPVYGRSCIEIHHLKPIFQYAGKSVEQTIDEALTNLLPVCPNCHRVIHKNNITLNKLPDFKQHIMKQQLSMR